MSSPVLHAVLGASSAHRWLACPPSARLGERFGSRPTLILSADDSLATRREVMELGLTLLHKPVRPLALKSIMDRLLASHRLAATT